MSSTANATRVLFKEYVESGEVKPEHFIVDRSQPAPTDAPDGGVLVELLALSVDPYMRGRMRNVKGYLAPPYQPGNPPDSYAVVRVLKSKFEGLSEGDLALGGLQWVDVQALPADLAKGLKKIDNPYNLPATYFIGTVGMPGITAWGSLRQIAQPKAGEVAFVSGAAGAVGTVVGQLLKNVYGCKVIGSAGSDEKVTFLTKELGLDAAFNYKTISTKDALAKYAPDGIDIYFDNVGGETLEAALNACKLHARVVACGAISQYDTAADKQYGVKNLFQIVTKRVKMQGMIAFDYLQDPKLTEQFGKEMSKYVSEGKVKVFEHVTEGLENVGIAFCQMMKGSNIGKAVVKVKA